MEGDITYYAADGRGDRYRSIGRGIRHGGDDIRIGSYIAFHPSGLMIVDDDVVVRRDAMKGVSPPLPCTSDRVALESFIPLQSRVSHALWETLQA